MQEMGNRIKREKGTCRCKEGMEKEGRYKGMEGELYKGKRRLIRRGGWEEKAVWLEKGRDGNGGAIPAPAIIAIPAVVRFTLVLGLS